MKDPNRRIVRRTALLALLHLPILFAGFVAPYDPAEQHRDLVYTAPTAIAWSLHPAVLLRRPDGGDVRAPIHLFRGGHLFTVDPPAHIFLLGTGRYGRDVFSRLLYGGRISLSAGLTAAALALVLGTVIGAVAGYQGGWVDALTIRVSEVVLALPWLYLLLAARALLPLDLSPGASLLLVTSVLGLLGWAQPARLVRGLVLSLRTRQFVEASRSFGATPAFILRRHIGPQIYGLLLTQAALMIPQFVLAEVTLSFLGLGAGEPAASWGGMIAALQQTAVLRSYWWLLAPAVVLFVFTTAYHSLARAIEEQVRLVNY
jgi:peptide/nickel transport system permease protein